MTAFAEPGDLADSLDEAGKKQRALERATDAIRGATGQTITRVADDVVTIPGLGRRLIQLPQAPVVSIASVTIDGLPLIRDLHYEVLEAGVLRRLGCSWPRGPVVVTYTHGYADVPEDLVRLCAAIADRFLDGTAGVKSESETVGDRQWQVAYEAAGLFGPDAELILDSYRLEPLP